ncbi:MAG: transposase [Lachnospiraceae bacterium]|nr:transposase [Lachnospiraceae bacterium]
MPRTARQISTTDIYHVITRGAGRQILFETPQDYRKYLSTLSRFKDENNICLLAYCLMDNHVHLLIKATLPGLSTYMKKVGISYAAYYNLHYQHSGHIFQDRFKSQRIEDDSYLYGVFRYILCNPEKAGIADAAHYPWSSYNEYVSGDKLTTNSLFREKIGDECALRAFLGEMDDADYYEFEYGKSSDERAQYLIYILTGFENGRLVKSMKKDARNEVLCRLKSEGLTHRQLERLTGVSRSVIQMI